MITQTGHSPPSGRHEDQESHARDSAFRQSKRDDPTLLMDPTDGDLEDPVQINPRNALACEGEKIGPGDLAGLADQVAGPQVPVKIGVLEWERTEEKGERQEQRDQAEIHQVRPPGWRVDRFLAGRGTHASRCLLGLLLWFRRTLCRHSSGLRPNQERGPTVEHELQGPRIRLYLQGLGAIIKVQSRSGNPFSSRPAISTRSKP